ncbi:MAG: putative TIM-barrel fold metal-dependent hydrolase [Verrucomicrobiales bacterium]|jgi:predicted TIM-barrel fold metal-dependent hydrolase
MTSDSTRRRFLTTSSAALAAVATSSCSDDEKGEVEPKHADYIDAHVHVWTPDTTKYPLAEGYDKSSMQPPSFTPEELFAECKPHGVSRIVLIQMSYYKFDNSYMVDMMKAHPGVFGGVAIIDETAPDVKGRMDALKADGVRGFRLRSTKENAEKWADTPGMVEMWEHGAKAGLAMCLLADPDSLTAVNKMCERFPDTPVVIDHFARIGMAGAVDQAELDQLLKLGEFKHTSVKVSAFYALGKKAAPYTDLEDMIKQLRDAYGADRLMWASDCPFQVVDGHEYGPSISLIRDHCDFLSADEKTAILKTTADRVFFS